MCRTSANTVFFTSIGCIRKGWFWGGEETDVEKHNSDTLYTVLHMMFERCWRLRRVPYLGTTAWWGHWSGPAWRLCKLSPALMLFGLCKILMFSSLPRGNFEILILLAHPLVLLIRGADKTSVRSWYYFLQETFGWRGSWYPNITLCVFNNERKCICLEAVLSCCPAAAWIMSKRRKRLTHLSDSLTIIIPYLYICFFPNVINDVIFVTSFRP